jgi:hypothetical protein
MAALYILTGNKKGMSIRQLAPFLGVTQKTAWFALHRIRLIMDVPEPTDLGNMAGAASIRLYTYTILFLIASATASVPE